MFTSVKDLREFLNAQYEKLGDKYDDCPVVVQLHDEHTVALTNLDMATWADDEGNFGELVLAPIGCKLEQQ